MENLHLPPSRLTPEIVFDLQEQTLLFKGRSSPENARDFYNPVFEIMDELLKSDIAKVTINFEFEYFNTSSSKCLFRILKTANDMYLADKEVIVNWHYDEDDEDMQESGEDLESLLDIEFNYIQLEY